MTYLTPARTAKHALFCTLLLTALGVAAPPVQADAKPAAMELRLIHLAHRRAATVIPLIKPFVTRDGGHVTGTGYKLIVQDRAPALPQVEALVRQIDTPLKRLLIIVAQDVHGPLPPSRAPVGHGRTGYLYTSDVAGRVGPAPGGRTADGGYVYGTRSLANRHPAQAVRVLEDRWASLRTTVHIPVLGQFLGVVGPGATTLNTIRYKALTTGFAVRARVHDGSVVLDIAPRSAERDRRGGGALRETALQTTVSGQLGQWIDIGGAVSRFNGRGGAWSPSTYPLSQDLEHVWVKVREE